MDLRLVVEEGPFWESAQIESQTPSSSVITSDADSLAFNDSHAFSPLSASNIANAFKSSSAHLQADCRADQHMDLRTGLSREMGQMHVTPKVMVPQIVVDRESQLAQSNSLSPKRRLQSERSGNSLPHRPLHEEMSRGSEKQTKSNNLRLDRADDSEVEDLPASPKVIPEKRCRQCSATKTPMWRNDSDGNKTLCNACGVRLQRQVNKAKQNANAAIEPPPSLLAGKMPRSRTSPAKLNKDEAHRSLHRRPSTASVVEDRPTSRSESLVKRKSSDLPSDRSYSFDRKRSCNDLYLAVPDSPPEVSQELSCQVDLVVIGCSQGVQAATRVPNCTASVDLHVPGPAESPPGQLQVFLSGGRIAASCFYPKLDCQIRYDEALSAWRWDGTAQWKLLFLTLTSCKTFESMLRNWKNFAQSKALPSPRHTSPPMGMHFPSRRTSSYSNLGDSAAFYKMNGSDSKFLAHINSKIRQEAGSHPLTSDPKGLCTPVSEATFERLLSMFELLRTRTLSQVVTEQTIAGLCQKCPWAPNRAVGIAIFRYWGNKVQRRSMQASPSGLAPHPFPDSPHAMIDQGGFGAPGVSDSSAMTLQDSGPMKARGNSEESSAGSFGFGGTFEASTVRPPMFPPQSCFEEGVPARDAMFGSFVRPNWDPSFMLPQPDFAQQDQQEWDPLDPQTLACIADPKLEAKSSCNVSTGPSGGWKGGMSGEGAGMSPGLPVSNNGVAMNNGEMAMPNEGRHSPGMVPSPHILQARNSSFTQPDSDFRAPEYRIGMFAATESQPVNDHNNASCDPAFFSQGPPSLQ